MTEIEKIQYAKSFIDKLAIGINPLDDSVIRDDDIVNHVRISRCFFYVSKLLDQIIENGGVQKKEKKSLGAKKKLFITPEARKELHPFSEARYQTDLITFMNSLLDPSSLKFKRPVLIQWLENLGLIVPVLLPEGKTVRRATEEGIVIGLYNQIKEGKAGTYEVLLFSPKAQQFVFDHIDNLIAFQNSNSTEDKLKNEGLLWSEEDDSQLVNMYHEGKSLKRIATALKRSTQTTLSRMKEKGLLKKEY